MDKLKSNWKIFATVLLISLIIISIFPIFLIQIPSEPKTFQTIVIFRDDDIHSMELSLVKVNNVFIDEKVPVTLGVIPFLKNHSLTEDILLIYYLKFLKVLYPNLFEIALHGYTHQSLSSFHVRSEFKGLDYESQYKRIYLGKKILKEALNIEPVTFIPPFNTYDNNTVLALKNLGFKVISGGGFFTKFYYGKNQPFTMNGLVHIPDSQFFVKDWKNLSFYSLDFLKKRFESFYKKKLVYVQTIHYWAFDTEEKLNMLRSFIRFIKNHEKVKFMTLKSFGEAYLENRIKKTVNGWEYHSSSSKKNFIVWKEKVENNVCVFGLSYKIFQNPISKKRNFNMF